LDKHAVPRKSTNTKDEPIIEVSLGDDLMKQLDEAIGEVGRPNSEFEKNIIRTQQSITKDNDQPDSLPIQRHSHEDENKEDNATIENKATHSSGQPGQVTVQSPIQTTSTSSASRSDHVVNQSELESKLKLSNILNQILRARTRFPELTPENVQDAESAVVHVLKRYDKVCSGVGFVREQIKVLTRLENEKKALQLQVQELEEKLSGLEFGLKTKSEDNERLNRRVAALEREKEIQEANHDKTVKRVVGTYTEKITALQESVAQFDGVRKDIIRDHEGEKKRLRESHFAELKKQQDTHQQQWQAQQDRHSTEVKGIRADWTNERVQWNEVIKSMEKGHESDIQNMQKEFAQEREQWSGSLEQAEKAHGAAMERLTNELAREREQWTRRFQQTERDYRDEKTKITNEFKGERTQWTERLKEAEQKHSNTVQTLKDSFARERNQWTNGIDTLKEAMKKKYENELTEKKRMYENELIEQKKNYENELTELRQQHEYEEDGLREEITDVKVNAQKERERHEEELRKKDEEISRIKNSTSKEVEKHTKELKVKNEKLTRALVNRDHGKGLTDPQIGSLFKSLELLLIDFARITWESGREQQWPLPERALQNLRGGSTKTKLLKQQIIQSYLWAILYEYIFVTPCEVFGEEGKVLHQDWTDTFGRDQFSTTAPHWPSPSEESEKERYETIRRCKEEIQQRKGAIQKRREAFEQTLAIIFADIAHTVERVASLGLKESDLLKKLIKTAADSWLEICSQRYRVLVVLPSSNGNVFKAGQRRSGALRLIAKPEIRRIGNAQGQELGKGEVTIGGWQGSELVYESH
jgi:hypothetical protein